MYIIGEELHIKEDETKIFHGEVLETGYEAENESYIELQADLELHDNLSPRNRREYEQ